VTSINLGRPLVQSDPNSKIAQEIRRVARTIATGQIAVHEEAPARRTMWNSFFKRESTPNQFELQTSMEKI
jgi:MinD-like ATPase involved in chromosome partitioning or flagellar assembly